ncbi:MAG: HU family DNA-binding protein [Prevotella sp.]|nr:HU family DNA-binding protein [Prevotella sp.]MDD7225091.1 HU family DNA-binding protein [Prevotella sp.]
MTQFVLKEMNDLDGKGKGRVYPQVVINRLMTTEDLVERMQNNTRLGSAVIHAMLLSLGENIATLLDSGFSVKIDNFGTFSLSLGFADKKGNKLEDEDDKMKYRRVMVKNITFKPESDLIFKINKNIRLERHVPGVVKSESDSFTPEERRLRAIDFIERHGQITLQEYANLNNISRSKASRELNKLEDIEGSGIRGYGNAPHKVWKKK